MTHLCVVSFMSLKRPLEVILVISSRLKLADLNPLKMKLRFLDEDGIVLENKRRKTNASLENMVVASSLC